MRPSSNSGDDKVVVYINALQKAGVPVNVPTDEEGIFYCSNKTQLMENGGWNYCYWAIALMRMKLKVKLNPSLSPYILRY